MKHYGDASSKKPKPAVKQSQVNPAGNADDTCEYTKPANQNPHVIAKAAGVDPLPDHVDQPADTYNAQSHPDKLPVRGIFHKLYDLILHVVETSRNRVRLVCANLIIFSSDFDALAWFIVMFSLICTEVYMIFYIRHCLVRKTVIAPWQFGRDIHLMQDGLSIVRDHYLLLSVTAGLVVVNVYVQLLHPLPFPFLFGFVAGFLCGLAVPAAHFHKRRDSLSWPPGPASLHPLT